MDQARSMRRVKLDNTETQIPKYDGDDSPEIIGDDGGVQRLKRGLSDGNLTEQQEPFMGIQVQRRDSLQKDCEGDYIDVLSHPFLLKILQKQGDKQVLFADKVWKFTASGKMQQRILLITDFAIYIVDPDCEALKRRIALAAVDKMCLSELRDNFFAIIIPTEYDLLLVSTRKTEVVSVLVEATRSASDYQLEVDFSNSFQYHATAELEKEVIFEEVEGGVRTKIVQK